MTFLLYIVAMFGGSFQYEPEFFWATMAFILVVALVLYKLTGFLFGKARNLRRSQTE